jgi:nitrous oxidase accessory protein NosD
MTLTSMTAIASLLTILLVAVASGESSQPALTAAASADPSVAAVAVGCDRFAGPHGGDRRSGTRRRPFRTVPRLARSLRAGQTGCLLPGRYRHSKPAKLRRPGSRVVGLGGRARVDGAIWITERADAAEIRGLTMTATDSVYFIPIKVQADRALITRNRIRGARSTTCVLVGSTRRTRAVRIERNWIHHCGRRGKLDHAIYVQDALDTIVRGNVLNDNQGGWGVHLYPDADHTLVEQNLIDGNVGGVIFGGSGSSSSDDNLVRSNTITLARPRWNIEGSWSGPVGSGNIAQGNCLFTRGPGSPSGLGSQIGFSAGGNVVLASSPYSSRGPAGYRFKQRDRACASLVSPLPASFPDR